MKVIVASDSFKGSASSQRVNEAITRGIKKVDNTIDVIQIPIADGGEGTCDVLIQALGGEKVYVRVHDPLMREMTAYYGIINQHTAVIEMAQAAGLPLLAKDEQNPINTTTYGVGEMIKDAIHKGCRHFIIGIGGSATNDAGTGLLQALGFNFYDRHGKKLPGIGASLSAIDRIDDSEILPELKQCQFQVMCDVTNPFYGPNGASVIYGPQKGADPKMVEILDQGMRHFANLVNDYFNIDLQKVPGSGAAGGLGGAFHVFLNAQLTPGIELLFETIGMNTIVKDADLIITGEGKIDHQSAMGKVIYGIGRLGKEKNIPVVALCGTYTNEISTLYSIGITAVFSILTEPVSLDEAMATTSTLHRVESVTENIIRVLINPPHIS